MSRTDCVAWFRERYPGRPIAKSSCVGCPYHSNAEWLNYYRHDPEGMARTIVLDERLREPERVAIEKNGRPKYLHRSLRPLRLVLEDLDAAEPVEDDGQRDFGEECDGYCGT